MIERSLGMALAVLAMAGASAFAHISYSNRNFGTLIISADVSNNTQTVSSSFGWADATDADWGDSHRGRFFRFNLANPLAGDQGVQITVSRNLLGTGANNTFLPAFSLFSGLAQLAPEALAHDSSTLSVASRPAGTEGSFRSLTDWSIGNDPTYNIPGDPTSGVLYAARLSYFRYIGHAVDGTSANFGNAAGIIGDGPADGFITATFSGLAAGDYSLFVGGASYDLQATETGPTYPTYGFNVTVGLVPEPTAASLVFAALTLFHCLRLRKGDLSKKVGRRRANPGFSMPEMMVAILVVGFLTGIGLATVQDLTEKNKGTQCLNNLRQIGVAAQLYAGENAGRFPDTSHQAGRSWTNTLAAFLKTNFIGRCPAVRQHRSGNLTYAWNDCLTDGNGNGIMAAAFRRPSATIVVAELATNQTGEHFHFAGTRGGAGRISANQFRSFVNVECHGNGANYLFGDGHVEFITWPEVQRRLAQPESALIVP